MPISSVCIVFGAILLPAVLYFYQALKERKNIEDIRDFFPLKRSITTAEYRSTTVAAGMSLATVIIAFINLAPLMGMTLFVSVASFALSFLILYPCAGRIMEANPENDSIQTFLGKTYQSRVVRAVALWFSVIGYLSIFSMELLVGVTVLEPFLGNNVLLFALLYLVFVIVYSLMSGYRAIIATDRWQLRFIVYGILALTAFGVLQAVRAAPELDFAALTSSVAGFWVPAWPFIIGIIVMNLPAPISDPGTWQRLCSTRSPQEARRGLLHIAPLFAVLWAALVLFGVVYSQVASLGYGFDASKTPLMTNIIQSLATGGGLYRLLLFVFILGLFSAMISTADSLLIVAGQIFSIDILGLQPRSDQPGIVMRKARRAMAGIAVLSFLIFTGFRLVQFDVVQLVFAIYGAQLAMFPSVFAALFLKKAVALERIHRASVGSVLAGFLAGWGSALYGKFSGQMNWLYNAPVAALVCSTLVFLFFCFPLLRHHRG